MKNVQAFVVTCINTWMSCTSRRKKTKSCKWEHMNKTALKLHPFKAFLSPVGVLGEKIALFKDY